MSKVTIIVPIYGVEKYIQKSAHSLFSQSFQDIDYLFIDDCSPDKSIELLLEVLEKYPKRKNNTRIVRMNKNSGQAAVRSYALNLILTKYFIFVDSDDWLELNAIEEMYKIASNNNADCVICNYNISDGNTIIKKVKISPTNNLLSSLIKNRINGSLFNKLYKYSLYTELDFIKPIGNMGEDFVINLQFACLVKNVFFSDLYLYNYYMNQNSITREVGKEAAVNKFNESISNIEPILNIAIKYGFYKKFRQELANIFMSKHQWLAPYLSDKIIYQKWKKSTSDYVPIFLVGYRVPIKNKLIFLFNYLKIDIITIIRRMKNYVS